MACHQDGGAQHEQHHCDIRCITLIFAQWSVRHHMHYTCFNDLKRPSLSLRHGNNGSSRVPLDAAQVGENTASCAIATQC